MNKILEAPFKFHQEDLKAQLSIKNGSQFDTAFEELICQVEEIAKPKAIYRISYIERYESDAITMEDITFHSPVMRINLDQVGRVFPYIATCGLEVDEIPILQDDVLTQYWLNKIKLALLQASLDHLREILQNLYRIENLSAMNPGSGEASVWPIEQQELLFLLFGGTQLVERKIGVHLLPSYLMVPEMSVSGILFPSETSYHNCQLCQREDCPGRRAHFDPDLWEIVEGDGNQHTFNNIQEN